MDLDGCSLSNLTINNEELDKICSQLPIYGLHNDLGDSLLYDSRVNWGDLFIRGADQRLVIEEDIIPDKICQTIIEIINIPFGLRKTVKVLCFDNCAIVCNYGNIWGCGGQKSTIVFRKKVDDFK